MVNGRAETEENFSESKDVRELPNGSAIYWADAAKQTKCIVVHEFESFSTWLESRLALLLKCIPAAYWLVRSSKRPCCRLHSFG